MIGPEDGLADLKPLLPFNPEGHLFEILAAIAGVIFAVVLYKIINRHRASTVKERSADRSRKAIAETNNLFRAGKLSVPDYCSRISLIVRSYLQDTLNFPAANMTAAEISRTDFRLAESTTELLLKCEAKAYIPAKESGEQTPAVGTEARQIIDRLEEARNAELP